MSYLAVHRSAQTSLATDRPFLRPEEWTACETASSVLQRLQQLLDTREQQLESARKAGRDAGYAEGRAHALQETAPALAAAWEEASRRAAADASALRAAVIELSLQVVRRIAGQLASADVMSALIHRAAESLTPDEPAVVRVHPDVAEAVSRFMAVDAHPELRLEVRPDPSLSGLDCVFETPAGQLLAGLDVQLAQIAQALHVSSARVE